MTDETERDEPERTVGRLYKAGLIGKVDAAHILASHYDDEEGSG